MMRLFGKRPPPPPAPVERIHPWDGRFPLLQLSPVDTLTMGQAFSGISATGSAGGGKTSILAHLAYALMVAGCGFVWCCAKADEVRLVRRLARAANRERDVIVIGLDVDGRMTEHGFNAIQYELAHSQGGTTSLIDYLMHAHDILSREEGKASHGGSGSDRFWQDQFRRLLRYCIDTAELAGREISVRLLREIQLSGLASREELNDADLISRRAFYQCLREAEARLDRGEIEEEDFQRILDFWMNDYANLDMKPKGTIAVMFAALADSFYAEKALRPVLTGRTTVTPDDVIERGKIVCLSLPTSIFHKAGRMGQSCFKFSYQRRMIARQKPETGYLRPSVLWVDEAHQFAHAYDAEYFAEVRSNRGINVFLEQGVGGYMDALGLESLEKLDRFLQNLTTKFVFQNTSPKTNEFCADVIGRRLIEQESESDSVSMGRSDGATSGTTVTKVERYQVLPGEFASLRRGGPENGLEVDCYIIKNGGIFNHTGTNYLKATFRQTDLTR